VQSSLVSSCTICHNSCMQGVATIERVQRLFLALDPVMDERSRRVLV
jgi:hypothetical protein